MFLSHCLIALLRTKESESKAYLINMGGLGGGTLLAFFVTGFWFFLEALVHYNVRRDRAGEGGGGASLSPSGSRRGREQVYTHNTPYTIAQIGKNGHWFPVSFPEGEELALIIFSIFCCSALSTITTNTLSRCLERNEHKAKEF